MASIASITKAKAVGLALKNITGVEPEYEYQDNRTRVYYPSSDIPAVRKKLQSIGSKTGDVMIDYMPVVAPELAKSVLPYAIGLIALGYIVGKIK